MTVRIPPNSTHNKSEVWTIDFREAAPALANSTMFLDDPLSSRVGGLAIGIPGELLGLEEAHRRWGTVPWAKLVMPVAELAKGWRVDKELAKRMQVAQLTLVFENSLFTNFIVRLLLDARFPGLVSNFCSQRPPSARR